MSDGSKICAHRTHHGQRNIKVLAYTVYKSLYLVIVVLLQLLENLQDLKATCENALFFNLQAWGWAAARTSTALQRESIRITFLVHLAGPEEST